MRTLSPFSDNHYFALKSAYSDTISALNQRNKSETERAVLLDSLKAITQALTVVSCDSSANENSGSSSP